MSKFNFIYAEDLSHREKTVYIYLRDRADASGVCWPGIKTIAGELASRPAPSSGPLQIWNTGSSLRSGSATAPTAALPAICTA